MASIKISNLPPITPGTLTDDDQFVLNDANQTTSRLSYANLKERFLEENHTFSGSVNFTGDVNVNINSTNTNVLTVETATVLINESEARSAALISENTDDITDLRALAHGPMTGGVYPGGTFVAPANDATHIVAAVNAVAGAVTDNGALLADAPYAPLAGATFTGDVDVQGTLAVDGSAVVTVQELADNNENVVLKGAREIGDASEYTGNADSFFTKKEANDRFLQISVNDIAALLGVGQYPDNATAAADIGVGAIYLQVVAGVAQGLKITA